MSSSDPDARGATAPLHRRGCRVRAWKRVRVPFPAALLLLALVATLPACSRFHRGPDRIVLVTIDTLRADHVGAYGDEGAHTPVLDQLASSGVRFAEAISPAPLTLPSHTSIMTGLEPPAHGVRDNSVFTVSPDIPLLAEHLHQAGYATAAFIGAVVLDSRYGLNRGFDVYDDKMAGRRAANTPFSFAERTGDKVVDAARAWLANAPDRFFIWVHLYDPHADYRPPPQFAKLAGGDDYAGEIAFADFQVGRLLRDVTLRWGWNSLVVAVTADHGESLGEHQEHTHSYTLYDATQHVPLILMGSGIRQGLVVRKQVRLIDVAPTLLDLAGAAPLPNIQGRSLRSLLGGGNDDTERPAYMETLATQLEMGWSPLLGLRTAQYKYIRAPRPELYDLKTDPKELHNLASSDPTIVQEMDRALQTHLANARPLQPTLELHADERARLESLGYVVPSTDQLSAEKLGVVGGPNPADHMREAEAILDASTLIGQGWPGRALAELKTVQSGGSRVARTRAMAALLSGHPAEGIAGLEALRQAGQAGPADLTFLGLAYLATGRVEDSRKVLQDGHQLDPGAQGPLMGLASVAEKQGDVAAAERWLKEAEAKSEDPGVPRANYAALLLRHGRTKEADTLLASVNPEILAEPGTALSLSEAERQAGRPEKELEALKRALKVRPRHHQLLAAYASALEATGRERAALAIRRRAYALAPEDPRSKNDLAWGMAVAGTDLDEALRLASEARKGLGDEPFVLDTVATVHLARSEAKQALQAAEQGLPKAPPQLRPHLLYVRAAALAQIGRTREAAAALRELRASPTPLEPPWRERAEALERRLGLEPGAHPAAS